MTRFRPGDRVFADLYPFGQGSFAEYACAPGDGIRDDPRRDVVRGRRHAAALGDPRDPGPSAAQRPTRPGPGDKVLIDGASGNVGPFAVQIAKAMGAEVTGVAARPRWTSSARSVPTTSSTTRRPTTRTTGERYDWIVDTDSHHPILRIRRALRPRGVYVTLGGSSRRILSAMALGPVISLATGKWTGLMLWWKPFTRRTSRP